MNKIIRNSTYNNGILFLDGHCSSGKSLLSRISQCYEGVEISREEEPFHITQVMYRSGVLDRNSTITLLKMYTDRYIYNQMIGRNINLRPSDVTTLFAYPYKEKYIQRLLSKEREPVSIAIEKEKPIFQNMSQNALIDIDLYLETFGDRFKLIYMKRNIKDVIRLITNRRFGERIGTDPTEITMCIEYEGEVIPYYAVGWEKEYMEMTPEDRIRRWVEQDTKDLKSAYNRLNTHDKKQVLFVEFEKFVKNPYPYCKKIKQFLGRDYDEHIMECVLKAENCPR